MRASAGALSSLVWVAVGLAGAGLAAPAQAATCTGGSGVSVIVDFGSSVRTGCAAGDPASAWAAIESAGFAVEGTQRFPATFICRVAGYPGPGQEACVQTPPASAYWALWSAPAGGSWTYAAAGAASLDPAPGTAIGLAFGAGRTPAQAPPQAPATPPPTPATPPPGTTTQPTSFPTSPSSAGTRSGPTGASATEQSAGPSKPPQTTSTAPATTTPGESTTNSMAAPGPSGTPIPPAAGAGKATSSGDSGPSALAIIAAGAGVGILLVLGAIVVRRQRDRATKA